MTEQRTYRIPDEDLDTPPNLAATRYAADPEHPLARVPLGALLVARRYLWVDARDVDWADLDDVEAVADALVLTLATHGHVRLVASVEPVTEE